MRTLLLTLAAASGLWGAAAAPTPAGFQNPPDEFRPIPFWGWTGDMSRAQIKRQLELMRAQKLTNVMLYPRYGLEVPYLSEEYTGLVRYAVEQARDMGLKIWLYDEYTWPSGTAGKRIPREHPEFRSTSLRVFQHYLPANDARRRVDLLLPPDVFHIVAVSPTGRKMKLTPQGDRLAWQAPPGAWRVLVFWAHRSEEYVDTLDPRATQKFIDITYEGYRRAVGQYFGSVIIGIFGDEPVMFFDRNPGRFGEYEVKSFPWTANLPREFRADHGYDIAGRIEELLEGGDVRRDLWATATRLYSTSFHGKLAAWCEKYGIAYTSHLLSEEPASALVLAEGDYFASQRAMHVPSIDEISTRSGFGGDYPNKKIPVAGVTGSLDNTAPGEWIAPKMAQSTAEWMGRRRTVVEVYALGPPSITLNEMYRMVNWEAVHGLNSFLLAVFPTSLRGAPISTAYLPAIFYQQPWYKYYSHYSDYVARVGYLLTHGERVSRTGVVYPAASAWGNPRLAAELNTPLRDLTRLLLESHRDFTFVFETGLDRAATRRFDALYVPPLDKLEPALARYVKAFKGPVYFYGKRPEGFEGGQVITKEHFPLAPAPGDVRVTAPAGRRILVQHRKAGDADIVFLFNASTSQTEATIELPGKGRAEYWEATTGEIRPAGNPARRVFEPGEGVFLVMRPGTPQAVAAKAAAPRVIEIQGPWEFRAERENSLRLKNWKPAGAGLWETAVEIDHLPARLELSLSQDLVDRVWVNGKEVDWHTAGSRYLDDHNREVDVTALLRTGRNMVRIASVRDREYPFLYYGYLLGDFSVRGGRVVAPARQAAGPWTAAGYPEYAGTGIYSRTIEGVTGRVTLELTDVAMDPVEVRLNGQLVGTRLWEPYRFDLSGKLRPGANKLEVRVTNSMANMMFGPIEAGLLGPVRLLVEAGGGR